MGIVSRRAAREDVARLTSTRAAVAGSFPRAIIELCSLACQQACFVRRCRCGVVCQSGRRVRRFGTPIDPRPQPLTATAARSQTDHRRLVCDAKRGRPRPRRWRPAASTPRALCVARRGSASYRPQTGPGAQRDYLAGLAVLSSEPPRPLSPERSGFGDAFCATDACGVAS